MALAPRLPVTVHGAIQTDKPPSAILRDRQTESLSLRVPYWGTDWFCIVLSRIPCRLFPFAFFKHIALYSLLSFSSAFVFRHLVYWFPQHLLWNRCDVSFFALWRFWFCCPFPLSSVQDLFCFKKISRPCPVAANNWNLYSGFSFVLLNIIASHCHHFRGAFVLLHFLLLFPRYLLWSLDRFPFVSRRASRCYYRPFLFQPRANQ